MKDTWLDIDDYWKNLEDIKAPEKKSQEEQKEIKIDYKLLKAFINFIFKYKAIHALVRQGKDEYCTL